MAQQLLNSTQVSPFRQQVRPEGMPQGVRVCFRRQSARNGKRLQDASDGARRQARNLRRVTRMRLPLQGHQKRPGLCFPE